MSETRPPEPPPVITDKRGKGKRSAPAMPTAEELLTATDAQDTEFARQQQEEAERIAAFEAMSDEEKQALLAQQAAENEGVPYAGGGMQNEGEQKKEVLTVFAVVVSLDGEALATVDLDILQHVQPLYPCRPQHMKRACQEIVGDIQAAETSELVVRTMQMTMQAQMAQARAQGLQSQLQARGMRG